MFRPKRLLVELYRRSLWQVRLACCALIVIAGACESEETLSPGPPVNLPPVASIEAPQDSQFIRGDTITLIGSATDPEEGPLPEGALSWFFAGSFEPIGTGAVQELADLELGEYEVVLVATDSGGLADTTGKAFEVVVRPPPPLLWALSFEAYLGSPALAKDGTLYVPTAKQLCAIDSKRGIKLWCYETETYAVRGVAVGDDGNLYLSGAQDYTSTTPRNVLSYTSSGELRWALETPHRLHGIPALGADGTVFVGVRAAGVWAVNPDGTFKWTHEMNHPGGSIAVNGDTLYTGGNGWFWAIDALDGSVVWQTNGNGMENSRTLGFIAIGAAGTTYVNDRGQIEAWAPDGSILWAYKAGYDGWAAPSVGPDGTIYVGRDDGSLLALNPDGTLKWEFTPDPPVFPPEDQLPRIGTTPALTASGVIYHSAGQFVYAISDKGDEIWRFETGNSRGGFWVPSPLVGPDGTLYVPTEQGMLYALAGDSPLDTDAPWPMVARGPRHSSRVGGP